MIARLASRLMTWSRSTSLPVYTAAEAAWPSRRRCCSHVAHRQRRGVLTGASRRGVESQSWGILRAEKQKRGRVPPLFCAVKGERRDKPRPNYSVVTVGVDSRVCRQQGAFLAPAVEGVAILREEFDAPRADASTRQRPQPAPLLSSTARRQWVCRVASSRCMKSYGPAACRQAN